MTKNQENLIRFIADYRVKYGLSPTFQEMVLGIGVFDHKSIAGIISTLIKQGFLEKGNKKTRAILLTDKAFEFLGIPLLRRQQMEEFNFIFQQRMFSASSSLSFSSPSDYVGHGERSVKNDGTSFAQDLRVIVGNTVANIATRVSANEEIGAIFSWALLLTGLTWVNINIIENGTNAFIWTVIESIIIKFISKKITL